VCEIAQPKSGPKHTRHWILAVWSCRERERERERPLGPQTHTPIGFSASAESVRSLGPSQGRSTHAIGVAGSAGTSLGPNQGRSTEVGGERDHPRSPEITGDHRRSLGLEKLLLGASTRAGGRSSVDRGGRRRESAHLAVCTRGCRAFARADAAGGRGRGPWREGLR